MSTCLKPLVIVVFIACLFPSVRAATVEKTVVQWGDAGGEDIIVAAQQFSAAMSDVYTPATAINPAVGANYYSSNAGRTPIFNGAYNTGPAGRYGSGELAVFNNWGGSDAIAAGRNTTGTVPESLATNEVIIVWESDNFLSIDQPYRLKSITFEGRLREEGTGPDDSAVYRYVLRDRNGDFHISQEFTHSPNKTYSAYTPVIEDLNWFAYTPFGYGGNDAGVDTIRAPSNPSLMNFTGVGLYTAVVDADTNWAEQDIRYFEVTAETTVSTVVKWGKAGGDTDIIVVAANGDSTTMDDTYADGSSVTLNAPNTDYYENYDPATDTPLFNGAGTYDRTLEVRSAADGDSFQYPYNLGTGSHQHMYAWEVGAHTLTNGGTLVKLSVESKLRTGNNSGTRRFLVKEWGSWYISEPDTVTTAYTSWSADPTTLSWYRFTPFNAGAHSIGASASPTFKNYEAVGIFYDSGVTGGTWADIRTRYFEVKADFPPTQGTVFIVR